MGLAVHVAGVCAVVVAIREGAPLLPTASGDPFAPRAQAFASPLAGAFGGRATQVSSRQHIDLGNGTRHEAFFQLELGSKWYRQAAPERHAGTWSISLPSLEQAEHAHLIRRIVRRQGAPERLVDQADLVAVDAEGAADQHHVGWAGASRSAVQPGCAVTLAFEVDDGPGTGGSARERQGQADRWGSCLGPSGGAHRRGLVWCPVATALAAAHHGQRDER